MLCTFYIVNKYFWLYNINIVIEHISLNYDIVILRAKVASIEKIEVFKCSSSTKWLILLFSCSYPIVSTPQIDAFLNLRIKRSSARLVHNVLSLFNYPWGMVSVQYDNVQMSNSCSHVSSRVRGVSGVQRRCGRLRISVTPEQPSRAPWLRASCRV